ERERLVAGSLQQRLIDVIEAERGHALQDERIETVETADGAKTQVPADGRLGIDIVEMGETWRILRRAVHGDGVNGLCLPGGGDDGGQQKQSGNETTQKHTHN